MPVRKLTKAETEKFFRLDRKSLVLCRANHSALILFYEDLMARLNPQ